MIHVRKFGQLLIHLHPPWGPMDWRVFKPIFLGREILKLGLNCNEEGFVMFHEALHSIVRMLYGRKLPQGTRSSLLSL